MLSKYFPRHTFFIRKIPGTTPEANLVSQTPYPHKQRLFADSELCLFQNTAVLSMLQPFPAAAGLS